MPSPSTRKLPPSTSCKDTSNFDDYGKHEGFLRHKILVVGTDLGRRVGGITMEIKGGVGYVYTDSEKGGLTLIGKFISFADAKTLFGDAKELKGGSFFNWKLSFQGKRMSIDWPQLRMQEAKIPNSTETKKRSVQRK